LPSKRDVELTAVISKIVAMARFHYPRSMTDEEKAGGKSSAFGPLPAGSNVELCQEFFDKLEHCETTYIDREKTYCSFFLDPLSLLPIAQPLTYQ
jgi:hypothetical protein